MCKNEKITFGESQDPCTYEEIRVAGSELISEMQGDVVLNPTSSIIGVGFIGQIIIA